MYRGFLRFRLFLSEDNGILSGKAAQRVFLHLNANIGNALICGSRELTLCCRSNFQPVASGQSDLLPIDNGFALPCNNTVDLFIVPVGVHKRHPCARRELVDADLRTRQAQFLVKFHSCLAADIRFRIVFHLFYLQRILALSLACV